MRGAPSDMMTAVHVVLYSEARYALPARPVVLWLAIAGVARVLRHVSDWLNTAEDAPAGITLTRGQLP